MAAGRSDRRIRQVPEIEGEGVCTMFSDRGQVPRRRPQGLDEAGRHSTRQASASDRRPSRGWFGEGNVL